MIKYLRISMPDESIWDIPLKIVLEDRKKYLKNQEENIDNDEIINWVEHHMKWIDIKRYAIKVINGQVNYQLGLKQGKKEIIEK